MRNVVVATKNTEAENLALIAHKARRLFGDVTIKALRFGDDLAVIVSERMLVTRDMGESWYLAYASSTLRPHRLELWPQSITSTASMATAITKLSHRLFSL